MSTKQLPSVGEASEYVKLVEKGFEDFAATKIIEAHQDADQELTIITTNNAEWGVWFDEDGDLYGEC